jgi:uncharacterized YigZ family protein
VSALLHTLGGQAQFVQEIRKSRFLGNAINVETVSAASEFIAAISAADADADHHCWAYRIGQQYRFFDANEPSGSAGKPILQAIDGQAMDRVAVVVSRYFGGIKLGVGGLVRAYGGCAAQCLRLGPRVAILDTAIVEIACEFQALALVHARLHELAAEFQNESFGSDGALLRVLVPVINLEAVRSLVRDATRGRGQFRICA